MILLLTNSFDLEDGFLTASNLEQVKGYLASTYPDQYSKVFPLIKNCSLESELDTVRRWQGLGDGILPPPLPGEGRTGHPPPRLLPGDTGSFGCSVPSFPLPFKC